MEVRARQNPANVAANGAIVINEIRTHSDSAPNDWVELYNTTDSTVDIGGWFLSDNRDNLKKYQIAAGQSIPPGGYKSLRKMTILGRWQPTRVSSWDLVLANWVRKYIFPAEAVEISPAGTAFGRNSEQPYWTFRSDAMSRVPLLIMMLTLSPCKA